MNSNFQFSQSGLVAKVKCLQLRWRICFVFRPSDPDDFSQFDLGSWAIKDIGADLWGGPKCHTPRNKALLKDYLPPWSLKGSLNKALFSGGGGIAGGPRLGGPWFYWPVTCIGRVENCHSKKLGIELQICTATVGGWSFLLLLMVFLSVVGTVPNSPIWQPNILGVCYHFHLSNRIFPSSPFHHLFIFYTYSWP